MNRRKPDYYQLLPIPVKPMGLVFGFDWDNFISNLHISKQMKDRNISTPAVITIPIGITGMDCQTNDVHPIVMVNALQMLSKHFARELVAMAEKEVGKNRKLQEQYFDRLTKKYLGENPGDSKIDIHTFI